jgi:hypothetical protein
MIEVLAYITGHNQSCVCYPTVLDLALTLPAEMCKGEPAMCRSAIARHCSVFTQMSPTSRRSSLARAAAAVALTCVFFFASATSRAAANPLGAQTFRGAIVGTVTDVTAGAIPDAAVTARNVATGLERKTVTDSAGNYAIPELPIGTYEVTVTKADFKNARVTDLKVEVASERRADITLQVSGGAETVEIQANAVQVESTTNTLGGTIPGREVADLPINGRDFTKFLVLVPGATGDPSGATDSPARSVCSAPTEIADALTITCSTGPI